MYHVYALKCANDDVYIGFCSDIKIRLARHQKGFVKSTKSKLPVNLIYLETYKSKMDATTREKQLKGHRAKSDLLIQIKHSFGVNDGQKKQEI